MLDDAEDHEPTTFELNPLGNRQRLKPRESFLARAAVAPPITVVIEPAMIVSEEQETIDEALVSGDHTISNVVLPSSIAVMLPAMAIATPVPSLAYPPAALLILPKEIHYPHHPPVATLYYPPTESHNALPIASRRVRYLAVPAIAMLALVVLGGAMIPPDVESMSAPVGEVRATQEATSAPRIHEIANEPPAPLEEVAPAKPVVRSMKRIARPGKITVNTSSALGNLRVRKW